MKRSELGMDYYDIASYFCDQIEKYTWRNRKRWDRAILLKSGCRNIVSYDVEHYSKRKLLQNESIFGSHLL